MLNELKWLIENAEGEWIFELAKPFASPGGKRLFIRYLKQAIPQHKTYVEPYAGGASLFFAKEASDVEVLSDLHQDIVETFKFLRDGSEADFKRFREKNWTPSAGTFELVKKANYSGLLDRVYKHIYLTKCSSWGSKDRFESTTEAKPAHLLNGLEKYRERMKGVKILKKDAMKVIKEFDAADTFFYLDPPWIKLTKWFGDFDEEAFFNGVKNLKGKVLVSYQGKNLNEMFKKAGWHIKDIKVMGSGYSGDSQNFVTSNYPWTLSSRRETNA